MAVPLIAAGAAVAARIAAKKVAQEVGKKSAKKAMTTGKAKIQAAKDNPSKKYEPPVKGSGKPKYQNVIKEARLEPKKATTPTSLAGKKLTAEQIKRMAQKKPNLAKEIDREAKMKKGQVTAKPATPKVPVKKSK